jgi:hypothetical protein
MPLYCLIFKQKGVIPTWCQNKFAKVIGSSIRLCCFRSFLLNNLKDFCFDV